MWQANLIFAMPALWFWIAWVSDIPYIKPDDPYGPASPERVARMNKMIEDCGKRTMIVPVLASAPLVVSLVISIFYT